MGLVVPGGPVWARSSTNLTSTPNAAINGSTVTPGTSNANGSSFTLISAVAHDVEYLVIGAAGYLTTGSDNSSQIDILIDPAGGTSWSSTPLIADLLVGGAPTGTQSVPVGTYYFFPIWIKSGTSIGARARTSHTAAPATPRVIAAAFGENRNPGSWWCGQQVVAIGTTAASSAGTSHTAGNSGAYSSWASLGSTTPSWAGAIQYGAQVTATAHNNLGYYFEFGVGGTRIGAPICVISSTGEACTRNLMQGPIFCDIPSGAQLQVRGTCSGTAQAMEVAAYLVI